jgi:CHAT domain-containing protein
VALADHDVRQALLELRSGIDYYERHRSDFKDEHLRISFFGSSDELYRQAVALQLAAGDLDGAFEYAERGRSRTLLDTGFPSVPARFATPASIQAVLPPKSLFIELVDLGSRVGAWIITPAERTYLDVQRTPAEIAALAAKSSGDAVYTELGRRAAIELYDALIRPIRNRVSDVERLLISADGTLNDVAFASLLNADSGRRLVEDVTIELVPGATWFTTAARHRQSPPRSVLAIGNPDFRRDLYPQLRDLRGADLEARNISTLYRRSLLLERAAATPDRVLRELPNFDVMHFAGHAVPNVDVPSSAYLVLSPSGDSRDGRLTAREIARGRDRRARWIVLAGCSTGQGAVAFGEGQLHLARAFLEAGAEGIVATRWDVDDQAATAVMIEFHRRLAAGDDPAHALAMAQRTAIATEKNASRPHADWAAFEFIGRADY